MAKRDYYEVLGVGREADDASLKKAYRRLAEVRAAVEEDGANFADVARRLSDDRRTASKGGMTCASNSTRLVCTPR